jgi:hypothetical protein
MEAIKMKKTITIVALILVIPLATAVNLQTNAETPDRVLYPNETVNVNLSVENLDTRAAENTDILLEVGERSFEYEPGDIEPGEEFNKTLELPEFPAGSYQAKTTVDYTGFLNEEFTETTRSGFRVQFPEFMRIPRQVYIQSLEVPTNVTAGEEKDVHALIRNDGDRGGDFTAAVVAENSRSEEGFNLSPGDEENITVVSEFTQPGVSFAETRLYAELQDELFLLDYIPRQIFVEESRIANIEIGNLKATSGGNTAEIQLDIENSGSNAAYDAKINLSSSSISKNKNLGVINSGELSNATFTVRNPSKESKQVNFTIQVSYRDGEGTHTENKNIQANLDGSRSTIGFENTRVEKSGSSAIVKTKIKNNGNLPAKDISVEIRGEEIAKSRDVGLIEQDSSKDLSFQVQKNQTGAKKYDLDLTASYSGNSSATEKVSFTLGDTIEENQKRNGKYSDKEVFITTDTSWQKILALNPTAIWTENNDINKHPVLTIQTENGDLDADSAIDFLQDYDPSEVTIVGQTPSSLDRLLVAGAPHGAGLSEESISRVIEKQLHNYWQVKDTVVYTSNSYSEGLIASEYASLINAPLIIENYNHDQVELEEKRVICIDAKQNFCDETHSRTETQTKYINKTNTEKVVVTNSNDLNQFQSGTLRPEKTSGSLNNLYGKTSLSAPFIASAKHQVIIEANGETGSEIDGEIEDSLSRLGIDMPSYLTIVASDNSIKDSKAMWRHSESGSIIHKTLDATEYADFNEDDRPEVPIGRIKGMTVTDVFSYTSRAMTYESTVKDSRAVFTASSFDYMLQNAETWASQFERSGFNTNVKTKDREPADFNPDLWKNKDLISYADHGNENWAGFYSKDIPDLPNSYLSINACSTCASETPDSFCAQSMRKGSIGYLGTSSVSFTGNGIYRGMMDDIYRNEQTLGEAFMSNFETNRYSYQSILIGDPTINLRTSSQLQSELK